MRNQGGFTIIELVVVIILLGIMAATALPRFMNVTSEAHSSVVSGVFGGLQSGSSLYHAQWVAEGQPAATTALTDFGSLRTTPEGYAYGTADNSAATNTDDVNADADCTAIFSNLLQAGAPSISAGTSSYTADFAAAVANTDDCIFYYTGESKTAGTTVATLSYDSETGQVVQATAALPGTL